VRSVIPQDEEVNSENLKQPYQQKPEVGDNNGPGYKDQVRSNTPPPTAASTPVEAGTGHSTGVVERNIDEETEMRFYEI